MKGKKIAGLALAALLVCLFLLVYTRAGEEAVLPDKQESALTETPQPVSSDVPAPELTPEPSPEPPPAPSPEPSPEPEPDLPDIDLDSWEYRLVNKDSLLEKDYESPLTELEGGQYFDSRAVDALKEFIAAARNEGLTVILRSSYRSYATQEYLFNRKLAEKQQSGLPYEEAYAAASRIVAVPGTSEHQLGLACDIVDGHYEYLNESLAETKLLTWMRENCAKYGFIVRYPEDKQEVTGIMYEPWHFRYVGNEAAEYIMEHGLCLEEFIDLYRNR
ncbi:MAG: M15 family metallopeptidase [Oscillospiraceae bacterium]|jgi:LAS superfamily LD-carboxypeptidase LdcB